MRKPRRGFVSKCHVRIIRFLVRARQKSRTQGQRPAKGGEGDFALTCLGGQGAYCDTRTSLPETDS